MTKIRWTLVSLLEIAVDSLPLSAGLSSHTSSTDFPFVIQSRDFHEKGKRHQENVRKKIDQVSSGLNVIVFTSGLYTITLCPNIYFRYNFMLSRFDSCFLAVKCHHSIN